MSDDIQRLIRLQELTFQIREVEDQQRTLPERKAAIEKAFEQQIEEIGAARLRHEDLVQQHKKTNQSREEIQGRLQQAQQKLMHVNTTREYSAVLNEIDGFKSNLTALEDQTLDLEEKIEALAGPAAEADARIAAEREKIEDALRELEKVGQESQGQLTALSEQREELVAGLEPEIRSAFERIAKARNGVVLAKVEKESCGACHVRLRPQVIALVRRGDQLVFCDTCRRILFFEESPASDT